MANSKLTQEELERLDKIKKKAYSRPIKPKQERYDIVTLAIAKGIKDIWRGEADNEGKSLTQFVSDAVDFYIDNK